ncbi:MAG: alpha/beta hydrolase [Candidatus Gracilibacteria bacterium]
MQTKQFLLNGILTSYLTSDNFNPEKSLFFLHGWGQDKSSFNKIYKLLDEKNISYIALDFPGFGASDFPKVDWKISDYAEFTKDFINRIGLVKPVLVGHSFGGRICIILGSSNYENLDKLVLIGAAGIKPKINILKYAIAKTGKLFFSIPGLQGIGDKIKSKVGSRDYVNSGKLKQIFLNTINEDLTPYLQYINCKTLLLRGLNDTETPVADGILMNNIIKNSRIKIFENGTHFLHDELPEEIVEEIEKFI